jgi:hypothetical protein
MSLRTRISPLTQPSRPRVRSRLPIEQIPQPREKQDGHDLTAPCTAGGTASHSPKPATRPGAVPGL